MNILSEIASTKRSVSRRTLSLAVAAGLSLGTAAVAQAQTAMAPPVQISPPQTADVNSGADSVFNWQEIPADEKVPLTRAAFDQGGYQLYDTVGETIIVPFTNQNLYVMKFAESKDGTMYFVREGGYPVLYVPNGGYLENATVAGARWFPFGEDFHPAQPVFLGIAPSWSAFSGMGWYPDMAYYGGYWGDTSFISGGVFLPSAGLYFAIGGRPYYGWNRYHNYIVVHPAPYHIAYYRHDFYRWADRPHTSLHWFGGASHPYFSHQPFGGVPRFGDHHFDADHHSSGDHDSGGTHSFGGTHGSSGTHIFQGGHSSNGTHGFGGTHSSSGGHTFDGHTFDGHTFGGSHDGNGHTFSGGHASGGFHGGVPASGGVHSASDAPRFSGGTPFAPGAPRSGEHSFNGSHASGGTHTFNGAQGGGDHAFGGSRGGSERTPNGAPQGDRSGNSDHGGSGFRGGSDRGDNGSRGGGSPSASGDHGGRRSRG